MTKVTRTLNALSISAILLSTLSVQGMENPRDEHEQLLIDQAGQGRPLANYQLNEEEMQLLPPHVRQRLQQLEQEHAILLQQVQQRRQQAQQLRAIVNNQQPQA